MSKEQIIEALEEQVAQLQQAIKLLRGTATAAYGFRKSLSQASNVRRKRGPMSAKSKAKIAAAQKARWAKVKAAQKKK